MAKKLKINEEAKKGKKVKEVKEVKTEIIEVIPFNKGSIHVGENRISLITTKIIDGEKHFQSNKLIMDGSLKLDKKTRDYKRRNKELYSFWFDGYYYNTMPMSFILDMLKDYYYGGNQGRDVIKRIFYFLGKSIPIVKPEYVLGFNNGWKLPQLEEDNGYAIIVYTDYQKDVYNRAKKSIKEYSEEKKTKFHLLTIRLM